MHEDATLVGKRGNLLDRIDDAVGRILKSRGVQVSIQKLDPYLNVDPGTMSPYQHGEVFVTDDGAETDLDLGHYERFTNMKASKGHNYTTGKIYEAVYVAERPAVVGLGMAAIRDFLTYLKHDPESPVPAKRALVTGVDTSMTSMFSSTTRTSGSKGPRPSVNCSASASKPPPARPPSPPRRSTRSDTSKPSAAMT